MALEKNIPSSRWIVERNDMRSLLVASLKETERKRESPVSASTPKLSQCDSVRRDSLAGLGEKLGLRDACSCRRRRVLGEE